VSSSVALTKMHGARNDFVVLDRRAYHVEALPSFARWVCDRHAGIGADGLIVVEAAEGGGVAMRTINADGSEAEMCGNGVRCAARWLDEAGEGDRQAFATAAGEVRTEIVARTPEYLVRAGMPPLRTPPYELAFPDDAFFVDLGNPHVVVFRDDLDAVDMEALAASLQELPQYPGGTNVHVACIDGPHRLRVRHWERGVGLTAACGTGVVAVVAAGVHTHRLSHSVEATVPGGVLTVEWDDDAPALIGPAVRVFDTEVSV
jgi:diaminopimelate epimerase